MKYIPADKLIAEIERLLKCTEPHRGEAVADGSRQTLYWIKDLIASLQQEQPEVDLEKDLANEADKMFFSLDFYEGYHHQPMLDEISQEQFRGIARHFAEWGAIHLNARKEE